MRHEIVSRNPDIEVRFYLSVDSGSYVTPHWHDSLELVYMIEGNMTVTYENHKTELKTGEFNIVNSRVIHSVLSTSNRALVLQIPKEMLKKYIPDVELYQFEVDMHPKTAVDRTRLERVRKIFEDMHIIYDVRPEGYLLRFNSLLYELLFTLVHSYSHRIVQKELDKNNKNLEKVNDIMVYIKEHHKEKCSIAEMSDLFGYSEDYLARFFKKHMGMTIIEYLYAIRIAKVHEEILSTNKSIQEIFEEHGCSNYRVAMRTFKENYGCTPKQLRKEENIKKIE